MTGIVKDHALQEPKHIETDERLGNASENFKKISKIVENCLEVGQILKKK